MDLQHTNHLNLKITLLTLFLFVFSISTNAQLASKKALSNTIQIKMPPDFKYMDANVLATKYPSNNKPSEVYTNEEATVNIGFKKTEQRLAKQNVFAEGKKLAQQLTRSGKVQVISSQQVNANDDNIHVFSFYSNAIDTKVYNVMFVFSVQGKMVIGSFNCTMALQNKWQVTAYEIIRSIKEI